MARANVCDKCGKVELLEDCGIGCYPPSNTYRLTLDSDRQVALDLCSACAAELLEAVRDRKDGEINA